MIDVHLFRGLRLDEFFINLLCLLRHFDWGFYLLVILTGNPELKVFLTELRSQESFEDGKSIVVVEKLVQGMAPLQGLVQRGLVGLGWLLRLLTVGNDKVDGRVWLLEENSQLDLDLLGPFQA